MTNGKYHLKYKDSVPGSNIIKVHYVNDVYMGDMYMDNDGFYKWWPENNRNGFIEAWILRELADKLDELNKEWDEQIQNDPSLK